MFDSIRNVGDFLSPHWLSEAFPGKLKTLTKEWRERTEHGKHNPLRGLTGVSGRFLDAKASLPRPQDDDFADAVTELHGLVLTALGFPVHESALDTEQLETPISVPLLVRAQSTSGEALHVLQAGPVDDIDDLFAEDAALLHPMLLRHTADRVESVETVTKAVQRLFLTDHAPRFVVVMAGAWMLLSDVDRWAEGRYLAFDVDTALSRRDDKVAGELAWLAGLFSADVLLPTEDGGTLLAEFTDDSVKHAVGVSEDLREGLRISIELIANEVIAQRRKRGEPVEGIPELPRELTTQALRFLYRILFLLYAEARPELAILPVGVPEYDAGYGLDRLRDLIQRALTGPSRDGHHLHDSLRLLFLLVNSGHDPELTKSDGLTFEPLRADLFEPRYAYYIDDVNLSNAVLQQVLALLLLSKQKRGARRGYVSYAQLGINQLGAVYEGLMAYSGFIADRELVELAKDGNPSKGTWLVPRDRLGEYDEAHIVWREDPLTGAKKHVVHKPGTFVYRLSGRDRQRSASYYTPEVLTQCVVRHSLAELITEDTPAKAILDYRICEPAMGSGAFLNEAINQLAAEYLKRRQVELNTTIDPESYRDELQKVKAYLALHRCYGVDLNATARELAEVSLWLNVMYPGLQAPWFGLHLKRGNSLIGARRATYDLTALGKAKKSWLSTPPVDRPISEGPIGDGEIHHFLLPAAGWGTVKDARQAKELAPDEVARLKEWFKTVTRKPGAKEVSRLRGLARRVERLWELTLIRLEISEREVARTIDVWRANLPSATGSVRREDVESALHDPDGPYQRLRLAMDAWCALFFWPVTTDVEPPSLDQWLTVLEGLLGTAGKQAPAGQAELIDSVERFDELATIDDVEKSYYGMKPVPELLLSHPWLGGVRTISQTEGFFHWELDFAQIFTRGGFDLQLGNPPWIQPKWDDENVLAEFDPCFVLSNDVDRELVEEIRDEILVEPQNRRQYCSELTSWAGLNEHLGSSVEHPVLKGVSTNLYTSFMERMWRSMSADRIVGVLHQESHFTDPDSGELRAEAYRRLRRHWQFSNQMKLFEDVGNTRTYGIHIYGDVSEVHFGHISSLFTPDTIDGSLAHDGQGEVPGVQYPWGGWDTRPHSSRLIDISTQTLAEWSSLFDSPGTSALKARLVRPYSRDELKGISTIAGNSVRVADVDHSISIGWMEDQLKKKRYARKRTWQPDDLRDVILQGPHFTVATPFAKAPNDNCRSHRDWHDLDLEDLCEQAIPKVNFQPIVARGIYVEELDSWNGRPYVEYYRLVWRRRVDLATMRTLEAAIIPPGPMHVDSVQSISGSSNRETAIIGGLWASLPFDYLVKIIGKPDVRANIAARFPAPIDHPATPFLLLRTLRLNCLTRDYAPLWEELYEGGFGKDLWTRPFEEWSTLGVSTKEWTMETPLRSEFERRAALVEIDALTAIMLGLTADQLCLMYRGQFAVLRKYEYNMWFDNQGRKIAKDHHAHGVKQQKDDFNLLQAYLDSEDCGDLLDRYEEPITRVDREAEMRAAYADFSRRLGLDVE